MLRLIPPGLHGLFDYAVAALLIVAPSALGASGGAAGLALALGLGQAALSLVTAYPLGAISLAPFWAHGVVESGAASLLLFLGLLAAPANGLFLAAGLAIFGVAALTDYGTAARDPTLHPPAHASATARERS